MTFQGYLRPNGQAGVRNHLGVLSTVALANRIAALAAAAHGEGLLIAGDFPRGLQTPDASLQDQVLLQMACHPNLGGVLVLCHDRRSAQRWQSLMSQTGQRFRVMAVMDCKGVKDAISRAQNHLEQLSEQLKSDQRETIPTSRLSLSLECGGSDASSAVCSNPAIGRLVDRHVANGGTVIVSETAEFIGAEEIVAQQSINDKVAAQIIAKIRQTEQRMAADGDHYRGVNPTAENLEAGLTTLVEKSMGAVCKIGNTKFSGCLAFGQTPPGPGLYFMDTPFFSPCSITGMVAGGAQLTLFSMGVFNPSGNPLAPTIKVCGNPQTIADWPDGIDVDLSPMIRGDLSLDQAADMVLSHMIQTASGQATLTEQWGEGQFMIPRLLPCF
jgi:altronate dehydratase large subunit